MTHSQPSRHPEQNQVIDGQKTNDQKNNDYDKTAHNLLSDAQTRWLAGSNPDQVNKLIKAGILPPGSTVIDFSTVDKQLEKDRKELGDLSKQHAPDTKPVLKELTIATNLQSEGRTKLDGSQKEVDGLQNKMDLRKAQEAHVQKDFDTLSKAQNKDYFYHSDLTRIAGDEKQPPEMRAAAKTLLDTWKKPSASPRAAAHSDYAANGWFGEYVDKDSIAAGRAKHEKTWESDEKALKSKTGDRDKLQEAQKGLDGTVGDKKAALDKLEKEGKDLAARKEALTQNVKDAEGAIGASSDVDKFGKVISGGGYYQVAEKLLGIGKKHTMDQERELKMLTKILQDEARTMHDGKLPKYLTTNDPLLSSDNLSRVMQKLAAMTKPKEVKD